MHFYAFITRTESLGRVNPEKSNTSMLSVEYEFKRVG